MLDIEYKCSPTGLCIKDLVPNWHYFRKWWELQSSWEEQVTGNLSLKVILFLAPSCFPFCFLNTLMWAALSGCVLLVTVSGSLLHHRPRNCGSASCDLISLKPWAKTDHCSVHVLWKSRPTQIISILYVCVWGGLSITIPGNMIQKIWSWCLKGIWQPLAVWISEAQGCHL